VRKEKKKQEKASQSTGPQPKPKLAVGDQVRLFDGRSVGSIDAIEKNKAIVNYGAFTTQVNLDLLELVKPAKKGKMKPLIVFYDGYCFFCNFWIR
jgi:DNA mismatch repair protein MutS2